MAATDSLLFNAQVTASSTAQKLVSSRSTTRGGGVLIQNLDASVDIYIGDANVTAANGYKIKAGTSLPLNTGAEIWVITASSTADTRALSIHG